MRLVQLGLLAVAALPACTGWSDAELSVPDTPQKDEARPVAVLPDARAPAGAPVQPVPACEATIPFMEEEDGTTPRQRAMFAPKLPRQPWPEVRAWLGNHGVDMPAAKPAFVYGGNRLGAALDDAAGYYDCPQIAEVGELEAAVCTRSAVVEHHELKHREVLRVDWVLLFPTATGLEPVTVGTHADGGVGSNTPLDPPLSLLPYVRLDLVIDAEKGTLTIEEAAAGVCDYACSHAKVVEERNHTNDPLAARETATIAEACAAIGTYVLRGTRIERIHSRG